MNRALNRPRGLTRLTLLLLAAALPAFAADVYVAKDSAGNYVRLLEEPCPVSSGWLAMKRADFRYQGKSYQACWMLAKDRVLIFDEAGDLSSVPVSMFAKEERI